MQVPETREEKHTPSHRLDVCTSTSLFHLVLKTPYLGEAILPTGSHEFAYLLQEYMTKRDEQGKKALLCAPTVVDQTSEARLIIQTRAPTTVNEVCKSALERLIQRFSSIRQVYREVVKQQPQLASVMQFFANVDQKREEQQQEQHNAP